MARANKVYIPECVTIGREVVGASENSGLRPGNNCLGTLSILISAALLGPTPKTTKKPNEGWFQINGHEDRGGQSLLDGCCPYEDGRR
jgi:hypothetical protein